MHSLCFRESAVGVSRYHGVEKVSFRSRTAELILSRYGLPRYHGIKLVRAYRVTVSNGNQGGTTDYFVPEIAKSSLRAFLLFWADIKNGK